MAKGSSISKTAVWILLGLLILGLAGFGATNLSGTIRTIGTVGDKSLSIDTYARQLQQEMRAVEAQTRQPLSFAQAQEMGLDRAVLQRFVSNRALDHEAAELGLSVGDAALRDRILEISAFQGVDGQFDREGYRFALEQSGLTEAEFETQVREELARTLVQGAVVSGVAMPQTYSDTLINYVAERRTFLWTRLDKEDLEAPLADPDAATLEAHYAANTADFTLPETKRITYAWLSPDALLDEVEIDEEILREAYAAREAEYNQPERRLIERLAFLDEAGASEAKASLEAGEDFDALVAARGLTLADIDMGDVAQTDLGEAGAAVFVAAVGDVVGPLPSTLGPALYRVNGILPAIDTSFEEALPDLRPQVAADRAIRLVEAQAQSFDDMLAGGATLEELDAETDMVLGKIDWTEQSVEEIAAYQAFREAASALSDSDFPAIEQLDDGGIFAMRLDEVLPPRPAPFADVRDDVLAHWRTAEVARLLDAQVQALLPQLTEGASFSSLGFDSVREDGRIRSDFIPGTPDGFMTAVFDMAQGEVRVIADDGGVVLVRLDIIEGPEAGGQTEAFRQQLANQASQALAQDLFEIFNADVLLRANPQINQQAIQAVHVNFN
jgi:peptidyl-prolyl cis-trans isomerase D